MSQQRLKEADYTIGSFLLDPNKEFKDSFVNVMESFKNTTNFDPIEDVVRVLKNDVLRESYQSELFGEVADDVAQFNDPYLAGMSEKLDQLFENTQYDLVKENSSAAMMNPIVGFTLPILKKSFLECHAKDVVMTEVAPAPIIKMAFERKFLKDAEGNKFYIPDIYYDDSFDEVMPKAMGTPVDPTFQAVPMHGFDVLQASGGSINMRDELSGNFRINAVKITVDGTPKEISGLNIIPNKGDQGSFSYTVRTSDAAGQAVEDILSGRVNFYNGTVSMSSSAGLITEVQFSGNLSNQNNYNSLEFDREREPITWEIGEGVRFNTGMTLERLKDTQALTSVDLMAETVVDMSETLTQYEDSSIFKFLNDSFNSWKVRDTAPFGYKDGFTESYEFSFIPPTNTILPTSQWANDLKWYLNREMDTLKEKLKTDKIMFVIYGNPAHITLFQDSVRWLINDETRIGGVQLEYRMGVMTENKSRVQVVSSMKVSRDIGLRIVAYPTTKEHITFKHLKYSISVSNEYRNPLQPLVPNIMGTSRFLTTELLPVQGEMILKDVDFGRL